MTRQTKWRPPYSDTEKFTHGHIYKTDPPIFIKFVGKCKSLQALSSEIEDNLCDRIPLMALIKLKVVEATKNSREWSSLFLPNQSSFFVSKLPLNFTDQNRIHI